MGQVLQRTHFVLAKRPLAADHEQRTFGAKRVGDPRHGIGRARSRRGHDTADFTALARIAIGCVCGDLLVAHVDDLDPFIETTVVDIDDMTPAKRPDHFDTLVFQRLRDQVTARDHRSGRFLAAIVLIYSCHKDLSSNEATTILTNATALFTWSGATTA